MQGVAFYSSPRILNPILVNTGITTRRSWRLRLRMHQTCNLKDEKGEETYVTHTLKIICALSMPQQYSNPTSHIIAFDAHWSMLMSRHTVTIVHSSILISHQHTPPNSSSQFVKLTYASRWYKQIQVLQSSHLSPKIQRNKLIFISSLHSSSVG